MEQINTIELSDETIFPDEQVLQQVLGGFVHCIHRFAGTVHAAGNDPRMALLPGWKSLAVQGPEKETYHVWMSAWKGYMQATIYFPGRLLDGLYGLDLSEETKQRFRSTKNVGQSKPAMFEIRGHDNLKDLETIIQYKLSSR